MSAPLATYRLQFSPTFTFTDCRAVLDYLAALGVTHIYASPIFRARPGSTHGYDVCDHKEINPELGGEEEFRALAAEAKKRGLGWIQDIVPNHMAVSGDNRMLVDVLENGPSSRYYHYFDIDWDHPYESIKGRMLAPFLGNFYGRTLENGEIAIGFDRDGFFVSYYDLRFPLRIDSYLRILTLGLDALRRKIGRDSPDFIKLLGILYTIKSLPPDDPQTDRYDQIYFVKQMLYELIETSPPVREYVQGNLAKVNGTEEIEGQGDRRALLENILYEQYFRLSYWKVAGEEINYRRFFSINDLISLRVENEAVFRHSHGKILELVREGLFSGLRVDHIDGLYDPSRYLRRLREAVGDAYLVVEKICVGDEPLPAFWPIAGSTGYDFMNAVCHLFVDGTREKAFEKIYAGYTGRRQRAEDLVVWKKRRIIETHMYGDVENLARLINAVSSLDRQGFDITLRSTKRALSEVLAHFPVYRTYISPDAIRPVDIEYIRTAVRSAKLHNDDLAYELDFLERFLLLQYDENFSEGKKMQWARIAMRFQQVTGPLMAKGVEDTAFYVLNRLLCLNEVGGEPGTFGLSAGAFHHVMEDRAKQWPTAMSATATHDTKRGEDARLRLAALSELPDVWRAALIRFSRTNQRRKTRIGDKLAPDKNDEYMLYQAILAHYPVDPGELPQFKERLAAFLIKAVREGKERSNWLNPDLEYENALTDFAARMLRASPRNAFLDAFAPLCRRVTDLGFSYSLAQMVLKMACPGMPDLYQGTEDWDLSFVDPDNRRPVDFAARAKRLAALEKAFDADPAALCASLIAAPEDGRVKFFTLWRGLCARRAQPALFTSGAYVPARFEGSQAKRLFGFWRTFEGEAALAIVPRRIAALSRGESVFALGGIWEDTRLMESAPGITELTDVMTGRRFSCGECYIKDVLRDFPVALLVSGKKEAEEE
ncbi:malto-oligosyltrehalose synthase [Solidesulfovibrio fructosivorans JJ]]|uniref:Malto-oligosyltrehalose synthase n=1 Tax=Solidesulfovibrio fructosivorans JJ] TaxID=596151 RepID=E1K0Z1_SOLFR|nr:malto-oligosyltrehalose synthase [Solidesulfovibrio fructosivorans]EFL49756.1 malto-oligosyltrehalose synthase [Solidesulfovibrio fructosivorans JJ]]